MDFIYSSLHRQEYYEVDSHHNSLFQIKFISIVLTASDVVMAFFMISYKQASFRERTLLAMGHVGHKSSDHVGRNGRLLNDAVICN